MASVGVLEATIKANTSDAERAFERFADKADDSARRAEGAGRLIAGVGGVMAAGLAVGAAAAAGAVASFAGFEQTVSAIGAVSGATKAELDALSATALKLGKETSFSAKGAAEGMEELAKAGMSTADIIGGGAAAALNLAAAGGASVADSAALAANAMTIFGLKGEDMAGVADKVAGFTNATSGSMTDFKFSLAATGAVANMMGATFDDTATAISLMGRAGQVGSDAGTSLKTMFMNLVPSTKAATATMQELGIIVNGQNRFFDEATGKMKGMDEIAGILQETVGGLGTEQQVLALKTMFGTDAIRAATIMTEAGAEGFRAMAAEIAKVSAADVAAQRLNNLNGSIEQMKGSAETLAIMFGAQLAPGIRVAVDAVTRFLNALIDNEGLQNFIGQVGGALGDAIDSAVVGLERLGAAVTNLWGVLTATGGERAGFLAALGLDDGLAEQVGAILDRVQLAFAAFGEGWQEGFRALGDVASEIATFLSPIADEALAWIGDTARALVDQLADWGQAFVEWVEPMIDPMLSALGEAASAALAWIADNAGPFLDQLGAWGQQFVEWVAPYIEPMLGALGGFIAGAVEWIAAQVPSIVEKLVEWGTAFVEWVEPRIGPMLTALVELLAQMNAWIIGVAAPAIMEKLLEWGKAFVEWVVPRIPEMIEKLVELNTKVVDWIIEKAPQLLEKLKEWGEAFVKWVAPAVEKMGEELGKFAAKILGWITEQAEKVGGEAAKIGTAIVDGISGGITSKVESLAAAARGLAQRAIDAARDALRSQSPSLEFYDIGTDVVAGFEQGIDKEKGGAVNSVVAWINEIIGAANEALQNAPSKVWEEIGRGTAQGYVLGVLSQQQNAIEASLTLVEASARSFNQAILGPLGDLTTEQARKIRDVVEAAAKAQQKALDAVAVAQAKAADAIKAGTEAARQAAQQAAASADQAVLAASVAARKVQETVADVQSQMAKSAQKAAEDAAKAAQKVADEAEKAAKKAAQEAQKAIEDEVKAAKEALDDFKNVIKTAMPGITKTFADALDLSSVMLGELTKPATKSKVEQAGEELVKTFAKALNMTAADRAKFVNSWMPTIREPGLQKLLQQFADDVTRGLSTALKTSMSADEIFSGRWDFLINKLTASGGFVDKMVGEFDKAGKKAGGAFKDGVVNTIAELNALPPIDLNNLLPGGTGGIGGQFNQNKPVNPASFNPLNAAQATIASFNAMSNAQLWALAASLGLYFQHTDENAPVPDDVRAQILRAFQNFSAGLNRPGPFGPDSPYGGYGGAAEPSGATDPPKMARGGIVSAPTYAMIGEGREAEAVSPLSDLAGFIDDAVERAMRRMGGGLQSVTIPVYVGDREVDRVVYDAQRRQLRRAY